MKIEQGYWSPISGWSQEITLVDADLVIIFADIQHIKNENLLLEMREKYNQSQIIGCSSAGEVMGSQFREKTFSITAIKFEKGSYVKTASLRLFEAKDSLTAGEQLAKKLEKENLRHVFVLSTGLDVEGADLVHGLSSHLPGNITISGGLAGDPFKFKETTVLCNEQLAKDLIAVVGFYGENLNIESTIGGGWEDLGSPKVVTRSQGRVVYELDGEPAIRVYSKLLGPQAKKMPLSGLFFPLKIKSKYTGQPLIRTVLGTKEEEEGVVFAGDVPEGSSAVFQKANLKMLLEGAQQAVQKLTDLKQEPSLALMVSCIGRRIIMENSVHKEVELAKHLLGAHSFLAGFYSYGEIVKNADESTDFHNQMVVLTRINET